MRLHEIIDGVLIESIDTYKNTIMKDCQPFINAVGGFDKLTVYPLYRGIKKPIGQIAKFNARLTDRKPKDTPLVVHNYANKLFVEKFGKMYRNGVFVTGDEGEADVYGYAYQFIPIGNFDFCWSPFINDFTTDTDILQLIKEYQGISNELKDDHKHMIEHIVGEYTTTDLLKGITSTNEMMFWCDQYYMVRR